jgi:mannose-6-phosphate isomerase-like protein (cupin superfamily)
VLALTRKLQITSYMKQQPPTAQVGKNFAIADLGIFADLRRFTFTTANIPLEFEGKIFLKEILNLTSCEISLNNLPPQTSIPFYHKHRSNEEIYIFIRGEGKFQVDAQIFPIIEGTIVRVDPDGERCICNTSTTEDLCFIVIQSRVGSHLGDTIQDGFAVDRKVTWESSVTK